MNYKDRRVKNKSNRNNGYSRSQRRLALVVLLSLLAVSFFVLSDNERITELRSSLFGRNAQSEQTDAADGSGSSGKGKTVGGDSRSYGSLPDGNAKSADELPVWNGENYVDVNGGETSFPQEVYERAGLGNSTEPNGSAPEPYEYYGPLDKLGRCTVAYGCLGEETMPEEGEERGDIASIHPSGWAKGQGWERSHLIAWALGAENANERNLVTGTHYFNNDGMRPLEEEVEHYIWNTGNHVLYMTRPLFAGDELVPRGVQMTARSVEDGGKGISFNVYCFNVTPGAEIDYKTGIVTTEEQANQDARDYVINTRSGVFHYPTCDGVKEMSRKNHKDVHATRSELTSQGYTPCGYCEP